jgi:ABC-type multidrug transport system fused ATPase/permease subunit
LPYLLGVLAEFSFVVNDSLTSLERLLELKSTRMPTERWLSTYSFGDPSPSVENGWPLHGGITFSKVQLRYGAGLPLVIDGFSLDVVPKEHIGIVGRTGAGKSSLAVLLFRLVEMIGGHICVDGVDITTVGLHTLRRGLAMIPQNPVLLQGTVRRNLDPFGQHQDAELEAVLDRVGLPLDLSNELAKDGDGLSVGERQLVSFARCLLNHARIIVMDEPTASVDAATDEALQDLVRIAFAGRTLLAIAHRLQTIVDFDRILVMEAGQALECAPAAELLINPGSALSKLVDGGTDSAALRSELWRLLDSKRVASKESESKSQLPPKSRLQRIGGITGLQRARESKGSYRDHP